jgi:ATP adenylyltransferase
MDKLWSPWRSKYIDTFKPGKSKESEECLFCRVIKENKDKENFLLHRAKHSFIMMNLYPYNAGHLMIIPYKHTASLAELSDEENLECMRMLSLGCEILKDSFLPHGFNIGSNIGRVAGAGIDKHIHFHIVPRWDGDTNFMPVLNDIKIISQAMEDTYQSLEVSLSKALK